MRKMNSDRYLHIHEIFIFIFSCLCVCTDCYFRIDIFLAKFYTHLRRTSARIRKDHLTPYPPPPSNTHIPTHPITHPPTPDSGTTAVVALYRDGCMWVANAGDSRAVLATRPEEGGEGGTMDGGSEGAISSLRMTPIALSEDHNPDRPGELERIERSGGFVSPPPEPGLSARVWLDQEMTRIGLVRKMWVLFVAVGLGWGRSIESAALLCFFLERVIALLSHYPIGIGVVKVWPFRSRVIRLVIHFVCGGLSALLP